MELTNILHLFSNKYKNIPIYCIKNENKVEVGLMALGACVVFVRVPDRCGKVKNIALSLRNYRDYAEGGTYAGATVGPAAGRIRGGLLPVLGRVYTLPKNDGENTLHGGPDNLGHTVWKTADTFCNRSEAGVVFAQHLRDGRNGFPGERDISVRYALSSDNTLTIQYTATTDQTTWLNLTNHTYWNLTGDFSRPAHQQILQINADRVCYNDGAHLPVSCESTKGTPFDFTSPRPVADALQSDSLHAQLRNASGYNNAYLLREDGKPAAVLSDPASGRRMTVSTDYPSLVFYSGGYLGGAGYTLDEQKISVSGAYALEAQFLPDAPHLLGSRAPFLRPGEIYRKTVSFCFS